MEHRILSALVVRGLAIALVAPAARAAVETVDIAPVWSGHPVGFALLTHEDHQFVAFYDDQRRMTVASRRISARVTPGQSPWHFVRLPQQLGWDSHNYVTMAIDRDGYIHLSGNMHGHPLVYFRTREPLDIDTFESIGRMVGEREKRCTYPQFLRGPAGELIFSYRDGGSGNGDQLYNVYDPDTRTWRRLIDGPLVSGEGEMNAYIQGPTRGPDGRFHMAWVWRDTPDCATNHDLSYARSRDLVHWENSRGEAIPLPITIRTGEIVDAVPAGGGLLNSNVRLAFDAQGRPVISYTKYEGPDGPLQVYNARLEKDGWNIQQASDWTWRWEFRGGGSIGARVRVYPVEVTGSGLRQRYENERHGRGFWVLDPETLQPIPPDVHSTPAAELSNENASIPPAVMTRPAKKAKAAGEGNDETLEPPALMKRTAGDSGRSAMPGVSYRLEWETLPPNRDRPRTSPLPPPSMLRLVIIRSK
jgi:hypothetical protein